MATVNQHPALAEKPASAAIREEPITDSSWLEKIKYDPATLQLTVTTKEGSEYVHFFVYPMTVDQLLQSPSKGAFYAKNIKGRGLSTRVISKTTGPRVRNPASGPVETKPTARRNEHGR
jgi:hypothetical protein